MQFVKGDFVSLDTLENRMAALDDATYLLAINNLRNIQFLLELEDELTPEEKNKLYVVRSWISQYDEIEKKVHKTMYVVGASIGLVLGLIYELII